MMERRLTILPPPPPPWVAIRAFAAAFQARASHWLVRLVERLFAVAEEMFHRPSEPECQLLSRTERPTAVEVPRAR